MRLHRGPSLVRHTTAIAAVLAGILLSGHGAAASGPAASGPVTIHGSTPEPVKGGKARALGRYNPDATLDLVVGLKPPHPAEEQPFLHDVQTRGTSIYHHFLSAEEWNARFAPTASDEQAVVDWARSQGFTVTDRYTDHQIVGLTARVRDVERALNVQMNTYQHEGRTFFANDRDPQVPQSLGGVVQSVVGLSDFASADPASSAVSLRHPAAKRAPLRGMTPRSVHFDAVRGRHASRSGNGAGRSGFFQRNFTNSFLDPNDLWSSNAYDFKALNNLGHCCNPFHVGGGSPRETSIAIATACDYADADLQAFAKQYNLAGNVSRIDVDGGPGLNTNCANNNGGTQETTIDVESAVAMSNSFGSYLDTAHVYMYEAPSIATSGTPSFSSADMIKAFQQIKNDNLTRTASMSWGGREASWPSSDTNSLHSVFDSMVGQGWSIVIAAGDNGAYEDRKTLSVQYPESDPDVVSAGGTTLTLDAGGNYTSETAWNNAVGAGGGGCSTLWSAPDYQSQGNFSNGCNGQRSIPDISLHAAGNQAIYWSGSFSGFAGTSIAAPEIAGFLAQENAYLVYLGSICGAGGNAACAPIGNPNETIYDLAIRKPAPHYPFYDITSGCNTGNGGTNGTGKGYCAGTGYDLATGWGSFNALQLAWDFNWEFVFGDTSNPQIVADASNPGSGLFLADQPLDFIASDPIQGADTAASGLAGYSLKWGSDPGDPSSAATPGSGNSFFSGPGTADPSGQVVTNLSGGGSGCHRVYIRAWDNVGLSTRLISPSYCYQTFSSNVVSVLTQSFIGIGAASLSASAEDLGCNLKPPLCVDHINVSLNTAGNGSDLGVWVNIATIPGSQGAASWYGTAFSEGNHLLVAEPCTVDGVCHTYPSPDTVTHAIIDRTPPKSTLSVAGAFNGTGYTAPAVVTLSATDNVSGVAATYFKVDLSDVYLPYVGPFTIDTLGDHTVSFYSTDHAGNVEQVQRQAVEISQVPSSDTTAPTTVLTATPAANAAGWNNSSVTVSLPATDPDDAVATTYYAIDSSSCDPSNLAGCSTYTAPFTVSGDGAHMVYFFSKDSNGNLEQLQGQPVNIDGTAPTCGPVSVVTINGVKTVQVPIQDPTSGLATVGVNLVNATASIPPYASGITPPGSTVNTQSATSALTVSSVKQIAGQSASINLKLSDTAGNTVSCDPVMTAAVRQAGKPESMSVSGVGKADHLVHVVNDTPGVGEMTVSVNGQEFALHGMKDGQSVSLDIAGALKDGTNSVTVTTTGKPGGSATLLFGNI